MLAPEARNERLRIASGGGAVDAVRGGLRSQKSTDASSTVSPQHFHGSKERGSGSTELGLVARSLVTRSLLWERLVDSQSFIDLIHGIQQRCWRPPRSSSALGKRRSCYRPLAEQRRRLDRGPQRRNSEQLRWRPQGLEEQRLRRSRWSTRDSSASPKSFDGREASWRTFRFGFLGDCAAVDPDLRQALAEAALAD